MYRKGDPTAKEIFGVTEPVVFSSDNFNDNPSKTFQEVTNDEMH